MRSLLWRLSELKCDRDLVEIVCLSNSTLLVEYDKDNHRFLKRKNMSSKTSFAEILEAADQLPVEDQENLIDILQNRLRDRRRADLVRDVREAQQEFAEGKCKTVTPEQLMKEILS